MLALTIKPQQRSRAAKTSFGDVAALASALEARVNSVHAAWRRLNDEASELSDLLSASEDVDEVERLIPKFEAYGPAIAAVVAEAEGLEAEFEAMNEAVSAASDALSDLGDKITDVTLIADELGIDVYADVYRQWVIDMRSDDTEGASKRRRRADRHETKSFLDGFDAAIADQLIEYDGGDDLWEQYNELAASIDAADAELALIDADIEAERAIAEAAAATTSDPSQRVALFAALDDLMDRRESVLAAKQLWLEEAAALEGDMERLLAL